jgi:hypothetical protein
MPGPNGHRGLPIMGFKERSALADLASGFDSQFLARVDCQEFS